MLGRILLGLVVTLLALDTVSASALDSGLVVTAHPGIGRLEQQAVVTVRGMHSPTLEARLSGASTASGTPLRWRRLILRGGTWSGTLAAPAQRGVYPIELRPRSGAGVLRSPRWLYRVFAQGTLSRPSFGTPGEVTRWWVRTVPRAQVVAMRRWHPPAFDHRDPRLHRLLVVAYRPVGNTDSGADLGMFVTAVRDGFDGRWRLLEATVAP